MEQGFNFRLLGFPVQVQPGFFFLAGLVLVFGLQDRRSMLEILGFTAVIFVSILVHELGHALMSRLFSVDVGGIFIHGFGGHVTHGQATIGQQLLISLAGPLSGLALGAVCIGVAIVGVGGEAAGEVLFYAIWVNVFWSLFNLLPLYPMDGGHALLAGLHFVMAPRTAALVTFGLGSVLGLLVALGGLWLGLIFVAFFAGSFTYQNVQLFRRVSEVTRAAEG